MSMLQALVLGLVQGASEFAPISSSAHLRIVSALLGWPDPGIAFSAVLHLGAVLAVAAYFYREVWALTLSACRLPLQPRAVLATPSGRLLLALGAGIVPVVLVGAGFHNFFEQQVRSLQAIGAMLMLVGAALWLAQRFGKQIVDLTEVRWQHALVVGVFQLLALLPGASRSGSAMLGGLCLGWQRETAARFSFLMGLPVLLGAGLFELPKVLNTWEQQQIGMLTLGVALLASAVSSFASITFFLAILRRVGIAPFVLYRLGVGAAVIVLASFGIIH